MTYFGENLCLIFDVGGSIKIPISDLLALRYGCRSRKSYLFISHFDKDHICNYQRLMTYLNVEKSFFSHLEPRSQIGKKLISQLKFQNSKISEIREGFTLHLKEAHLRCLWPPSGKLGKAENDRSLVFVLTHNRSQFLLTGDLPSKLEMKLTPYHVGTLKAGHHGSRYSSSEEFLKNIKPSICIISVGKNNNYGHPSLETLRRMNDAHCTILRTDRLGDITFEL